MGNNVSVIDGYHVVSYKFLESKGIVVDSEVPIMSRKHVKFFFKDGQSEISLLIKLGGLLVMNDELEKANLFSDPELLELSELTLNKKLFVEFVTSLGYNMILQTKYAKSARK